MSNYSSDDEKELIFRFIDFFKVLGLWQSVAPQILQVNSD